MRMSEGRLEEIKQEALEYYLENSFGFGSIEEYVECEFGHMLDDGQVREVVGYIESEL